MTDDSDKKSGDSSGADSSSEGSSVENAVASDDAAVSQDSPVTSADEPAPAPIPAPAASPPPPSPSSPSPSAEREPQPQPEPRSSNATPIAWLALLLVLFVAGLSLWFSMDAQRREADLLQRVQALESISGQDTTTFDQMRDNLERKIELETEAMQARQLRAAEDQQRSLEEQRRVLSRQEQLMSQQAQTIAQLESSAGDSAERARRQMDEQLQSLESRLLQQEQRIGELNEEDRQSWALAEAQYLLRLANQRLIMTGDTLSAEAMLRSADKLLRELGDSDLMALRGALAEDLAALRAVPRLDTQGLYVRLDALIQQTNDLVMFELPSREDSEPVEMSDDWQTRLKQGYESAIEKLSEYIVVSRRDVPVETLMDPQYEGLVRQNMRMLLEQAQVAMLSGNQHLYEQSLDRALGWVDQFFKNDHQAAVAMAGELRALKSERVSVELPNLGDSLSALDEVLRQRLSEG